MPHVELPQAEFKVVMLGDTCTGKTSLVLRFAEGYYRGQSRSEATLGAFFITKRLQVNEITCKIQIWDTAGQAQFRPMAPMYYKNAAAAICCFDVSNPDSFEVMKYWLNELHQNITAGSIVICIAATKTDLLPQSSDEASNRLTKEAEELANAMGVIYVDTSAKNDTNVNLLFQKVAERVLRFRERAKKRNTMDSYYYGAKTHMIPVTPGASIDEFGHVVKGGHHEATEEDLPDIFNGEMTHDSDNSSRMKPKRRDKRSRSSRIKEEERPEIGLTASDVAANNSNLNRLCGEDPMMSCGILASEKRNDESCIIL